MRLVDLDSLKVEHQFQVKLDSAVNEVVTAAVFNPNGVNFALGTSLGNLVIGSIKFDAQGKIKFSVGKIENISKQR